MVKKPLSKLCILSSGKEKIYEGPQCTKGVHEDPDEIFDTARGQKTEFRKRSKEKKDSEGSNSWHAIKQSGLKAISPQAKKRRLSSSIHWIMTSLILILIVIVGGYLLWNQFLSPVNLLPPMARVEISTNAVLDQKKLHSFLNIPQDISLMHVDIFDLKEKIESIPQVHSARVERVFPDVLKISINEHQPILKLVVTDNNGNRQGFLVSREGHIFKASGYSKKDLASLPYLKGISLHKQGDSFCIIPNMHIVAQLLDSAKSHVPHLFKYWKSVSLDYFQYNTETFDSFIKIDTQNMGELIFAPHDFDLQLTRLSSIVAYASDHKLSTIERIDLSLNNQATVKVATR